MPNPSRLIREARAEAGLSQAALARRLGVSQASVAQLERPGSNPSVQRLTRVLAATGRGLELRAVRRATGVDETLIERQLAMSPEQRIAAFEAAYEDARELALAGARSRGELA